MKKILLLFSIVFTLIIVGCGSITDDQYDAPKDLELIKLTDGKVKIKWNYSTQSTSLSFVIARKEGESEWDEGYGTTEDKEFIDEIPSNSFDVYSYKVKAFDGDNETFSAYSEPVAFFTDLSHPSNLEISQTSQSFLELNWTDNSLGEDGFKIDKKIGEEDWIVGYKSLPANTETFTDSIETLYNVANYKVYAFVNSSYSNEITNQVVPSFPAPINVMAEQVSVDQIRLRWEDISEGEDGFKIERKIGYGDWSEMAVVTNGSNEYLDYLTEDSGTIYYRIFAFQGSLISAYSEIAEVFLNISTISTTNTEHSNLDFAFLNNYLYIAADYDGVKIYDVSNQASPILFHTIDLPGRTKCLAVQDTILVAGSNDGNIYYYSISDLDNLFEFGVTSISGTPYDLILDDEFVFVAAGNAGLLTIEHNLEYFQNPIVVGAESTSGNAMQLELNNNLLYLADGIGGVKVYSTSNPDNLSLLTENTTEYVNDVCMLNNLVVVSYGENGVAIFDDTLFSLNSVYDSYGYVHSLNYSDNYLYFYDLDRGFIVLDVRNIEELKEVAALEQDTSFNTILIDDEYMYCGGNNTLKIIQIIP